MKLVEVSHNGRSSFVPALDVGRVTVVSRGRLLRVASVKDEPFIDPALLPDPSDLVHAVRSSSFAADMVTFAQTGVEPRPRFHHRLEWDNVAAADISNFDRWWAALPQATRKNCRRAARCGVITEAVLLNDQLVDGIKRLYNESPIRQGRRFWHYGKDAQTILHENQSFHERSQFIGAFVGSELIGFMKVVFVGSAARIMQILASASHNDKRPMNALIAKAAEICNERGATRLIYSKFQYGNKNNDPMIEFKRRNGFERIDFPRYYVSLTLKGRLALAAGLHRGALGMIPPAALDHLLHVRQTFNTFRLGQAAIPVASGNKPSLGSDS
jgi:hypothetical protein